MFTSSSKQRTKPDRSKFFGLLAAVWVSLALQPCAIAAVSDQECPHCPMEIETERAAYDDHCNPALVEVADERHYHPVVESDCCDVDEGIASVRVDTSGDKDDATVVPADVPASQFRVSPRQKSVSASGPPGPTGTSVPLHILKCVYLI